MKSNMSDVKIKWNVQGMSEKEFKEKLNEFLKAKKILFL